MLSIYRITCIVCGQYIREQFKEPDSMERFFCTQHSLPQLRARYVILKEKYEKEKQEEKDRA